MGPSLQDLCVRIIETMHTKLSSPHKHTRFGLWRICPRPKSSRDQKSTEPCCCPSSFALHLHLHAFYILLTLHLLLSLLILFLAREQKEEGDTMPPFISLSTTFYDSYSRTRIGFQRQAQSLWRTPLSWTCSTCAPEMISQPPPQISSHLVCVSTFLS